MTAVLDHVILNVRDRATSHAFYTRVLGFADGGEDGPFAVVRLSPDAVLLLLEQAPSVKEHLAFALAKHEYDAAFERLATAGVPYGNSFETVGTMRAHGKANGARGIGTAVYLHDPDDHLIELRHYERAPAEAAHA